MKRNIIGRFAISALLIAAPLSTAFAADIAVPLPEPVAAFNWTGWYVGGNFGFGYGTNTGNGYSSFVDPGAPTGLGGVAAFFAAGGNVLPGVNPQGVIGGGQIGYDWQVSPLWVLGIVADVQASGMKASGYGTASIGAFTSITESNSAQVDWFGTVRGKVGFAASNLLVYGTGGLAYGGVKANTTFNDPSSGGGPSVFAGSSSLTNTGWAAGGGVEYALSRNWTIGTEYLYVDLGTISTTDTIVSGPKPWANTFTSTSKFSDNIVRVFIDYKFGP
jgi:outer membrane immunogenic protein